MSEKILSQTKTAIKIRKYLEKNPNKKEKYRIKAHLRALRKVTLENGWRS